jgi:hypothetical protein
MKTRNPACGGVSRDAALGMAANSGVNYSLSCPVCGIPTQGDLCRVCTAWREHYRHTRAAIKALDAIAPRLAPRLKGGRRS